MSTEIDAHSGDQPVATIERKSSPRPPQNDGLDSLGELPPSDPIDDDEPQPAPKKAKKTRAKRGRKKASAPVQPAGDLPHTRADGTLHVTPKKPEHVAGARVYRKYWCGTMPDSLIQNIDVVGVGFPRFVGVCGFDDTGKPTRPTKNGQILELSDEQVERVLDAIAHRVLRKEGNRRGSIRDIRDTHYRPRPGSDRPLGEVLYIVRADEGTFALGARDSYPEPLVPPQE